MALFDSLTKEMKLQAIEMRIMSLTTQLYGLLIAVGLDPEEVNLDTLNPETDLDERYLGYVSEIVLLKGQISHAEEMRERVTA
jgi:hypothetical protein